MKIIIEGPDGKPITSFTEEESDAIRKEAHDCGVPLDRYLRAKIRAGLKVFEAVVPDNTPSKPS